MKKLVILGGGYGGLTVAKELLSKELPSDTVMILVDRMPYQGLKTEYYALAAGTVSDWDIRVQFPVDPRLILKYGEVVSVLPEQKEVRFANDETLSYDWLVIALGCVDRYHGIPGAEEFSHSIQTLSSTRKTYQNVNDIAPYGQVTIVGGGLSGVEVAAELRESRPDMNIRILDRGASILSPFPGKLQRYVRDWMLEHDIELRSHISLARLEGGMLYNQQEIIYTDMTIWTAGIQPSPIVQNLNLPKDAQGRLIINEYHQLPDYNDIFVVGDCAALPFSPSGQAAEAQGEQVAHVLQAIWKNETPRLGKIKLKGVLGSLGKKAGFGLMGKRTVMLGKVPRAIKSGVLWMSKRHFG
ncbi:MULTISPECIES: NAD(P)/FAD-dependent oxidoreductase [Paenibacillus]|uniref:NADH dehydrogenase n=1 Tax=Paenibacillus naphthalenovorans TaxID=162209 RepID=A0A0U2VMG6_9BACL|nr:MULTISPECIES: NAD(P)/FAD-dependent oxidoreductase [Paenibacillus]ALS20695.1 NADH dehydrogenase [Paenibacillus naphthalenovorans]GCL70726.1 NAD(P)/FAD-dependent oxidoreductase [Paenibacillus naphthalenovorans]SDI25049.1 NADH dehydrogenase [Paenibacillus naphthalenovorans]